MCIFLVKLKSVVVPDDEATTGGEIGSMEGNLFRRKLGRGLFPK
jgi:hypothetical protein